MKPYINKDFEAKAKMHFKEMEDEFSEDIKYSIENSKVYRNDLECLPDEKTSNIRFEDKTTSEAVFDEAFSSDSNIVALNFASFKYPGGGYMIGAHAQEEMLCHDSNLYNVIGDKKFNKEYAFNRNNVNNSLYSNFAIFSPDIIFANEEEWVKAGIITCAAPNFTSAREKGITYKDNLEVLKDRAEFVIKIAKMNNVETLILGAWGCGVFSQRAEDVARIFKEILEKYHFDKVVFAIPDEDKLEKFKNAFIR